MITTSQTDVIHIGRDNFSNALGADIFGVNQTNSQANSLLLGNGLYTNIRATGAVCDLGTSLVPFKDIYSNGSFNSTVNSRLKNDVVSNTSTETLNNLASFVSDKVIKDSGVSASTGPWLPLAGGTMGGGIAMATNSITNIGNVSGATNSRTADNIVSNTGTSTSGDLASMSRTTGKVIRDRAIVAANVVTNAGANVSGDIPSFSGITGKIPS